MRLSTLQCTSQAQKGVNLRWPAGVMCYKHWRDKKLNPSGIRVVSREFPHEPVAMYKDLRWVFPVLCSQRSRIHFCSAATHPRQEHSILKGTLCATPCSQTSRARVTGAYTLELLAWLTLCSLRRAHL